MFKNMLTALVGAGLALSVGAAGAYFTAQVQVADSVIRAGTIEVSTEPTTAPLSIDALAPGTPVTRQMTIANSGNIPLDVTVSAVKKAGITDFYEALVCRVMAAGAEVYSGPMSTLKTTPIRMAPNTTSQMAFEVSLPGDAVNALADDYARVSLYVDAEQSHP